jgi:hypothetical protein
LSGGRDEKVQVMDKLMNWIMTIDVSDARFGSLLGEVRSIALNFDKTNLLIGTLGEIYEVTINEIKRSVSKINVLMQSHYSSSKQVVLVLMIE